MKRLLTLIFCLSLVAVGYSNDLRKITITKTILANDTLGVGSVVSLVSDTTQTYRLTSKRSWIGWTVLMPPGYEPSGAQGDSLSIVIQHSPNGTSDWTFYDSVGANVSGDNQNLAADKFVLVATTTTINTDSTAVMPYIRFVYQITDSLVFHVDSFGNTYDFTFTPWIFPVKD